MRQAVAERYASAFFELVSEKGTLEAAYAEFKEVAGVFEQNPEFASILEHPLIAADEKKALIERLFPGARPELSNFLKLLVDRRRIDLIREIDILFTQRYHEATKKLVAEVTTARKLDEEQNRALRESLERMYGGEVAVVQKIDPLVLGGARLKIGDRVLDDTLVGRLEALRTVLSRSTGGKL